MDNDSLYSGMMVDSASIAESVVDTVAPEIQMPTPEQLGISISAGEHMPSSVVMGDTFVFPVTVSWSVNGSSLLVLPTGTASAKGLTQVGVSQESARMVKDGKEIASITFNYKIVAKDTGNLSVPVMKFEIPTQVGTPLTLRTESVPVRVGEPVCVAPLVIGTAVAVIVLGAGLWRVKRRTAQRVALNAQKASKNALLEKMVVLKQRINSADSRQWLLELEMVCKEFVASRMGQDAEKVNLETLQKHDDLKMFGNESGWKSLLEEFAHARYGGGKRDGFENKETWKLAMKLMGIEEEF